MPQTATFLQGAKNYVLTSDLAQYCLPAASQDENRKLAWINSVCFLFVVIGLIGLKEPALVTKRLSEVLDLIPVVFTPPEEPPKVETQPQPNEPDPQPDTVMDTPQVATVVAPDSSAAFPVPVEGPVILAPSARFASAPPPQPPKPPAPPAPKVTEFRPGLGDGGKYPYPTYSRFLIERGYQGRILLYLVVDPSGSPSTVEVRDTSGYSTLDRYAADWVKKHWQFPPGETRYHTLEVTFKIDK